MWGSMWTKMNGFMFLNFFALLKELKGTQFGKPISVKAQFGYLPSFVDEVKHKTSNFPFSLHAICV